MARAQANESKPTKSAPKAQAQASKRHRRGALHTKVTALLGKVEQEIEKGALGKVSVADFIRLLQLKREIDGESTPRNIEVTWVETLPEGDESDAK